MDDKTKIIELNTDKQAAPSAGDTVIIDFKEEEEKQQSKKKSRGFAVFGVFVIVLGILAFVFRDYLNLYNIKQLLGIVDNFFGKGTTQVMELTYDTNDKNKFEFFGNYITVLKDNSLCLYDTKGKEVYSLDVSYNYPNLQCNDKHILTYDRGGYKLLVSNDYTKIFNKEYENTIITAKLSSGGNLLVATKIKNYKAAVYVYNNRFKEIYRVYLADDYLADMDLYDDILAVATYNGGTGEIVSGISYYSLDSTDRIGKTESLNGLVMSVDFKESKVLHILTMSEYYISDGYESANSILNFENSYLQFYSIDKKRVVLLINNQLMGRNPQLYIFSAKGDLINEQTINGEIKSMTVTDSVAVALSGNSATVFDNNGNMIDNTDVSKDTKKIIISDSGNKVFIGLNKVSIVN